MLMMLKTLLRRPGWVLLLVIILASGLGAGLGLYGVADAVLFRPLPVKNPDELVRVIRVDQQQEVRFNWSLPLAQEHLASSDAFAGAAWYADWLQFTLTDEGTERLTLEAAVVSGSFFGLMGVNPLHGRFLRAEDDVVGAAPVAVIGADLWRSRFNADPGIVGSTLSLNAQAVTVVGIAPPGFAGVSMSRAIDVWMPIATGGPMGMGGFDTATLLDGVNMTWLDAVVRLAPGVSLQQAQSLFVGRRMENAQHAQFFQLRTARDVAVNEGGDGSAARIAWLLLAMVAVIVIVACTDAASLMLVRAESRRAAIVIRHSLGASRRRVLSEVLLEAMIVSLCAGLLGIGIAVALSHTLMNVLSADLPLPATLDLFTPRTVLVYALMMVATTLLAASATLWRFARLPLNDVLRAKTDDDIRRFGLREFLVTVQVGISVALVAGAFMFVGALRDTLDVDPGFEVQDRATASINLLAKGGFDESYKPVLQALRDDPRVRSAALAGAVPVMNFGFALAGELEGHATPDGKPVTLEVNAVSDGYFETLGIPLLAGRTFPAMNDEPVRAAIVNEAFAQKYWPDRSPLGLVVGGMSKAPLEIIGVVADNKQRDLREAPLPLLYVPYTQMFLTSMGVVVAADSNELAMQAIRETMRSVDPDIAIEYLESLQTRIERTTARDRAMTGLAVLAAGFATALGITGLYGTAAYAIRQRKREVGIRYALGATRRQVVVRFLKGGLFIVLSGTLAGAIVAWLGGRQLSGVVAGAHIDPVTVIIAALAFSMIALLANLLPVWRAARLAPMDVLRDE